MSERQEKIRQKIESMKLDKKFFRAFSRIIMGCIAMFLIAIVVILLLSLSLAKNNLPMTVGIIGIVLMLVMAALNISMCRVVARHLSKSVVVPMQEIKAAVQKRSVGELDFTSTYRSQDEIGELAHELR